MPLRAEPSLVVVVRHADKATEPASDPALSAAGQKRAQALADALASARIGAVVTTPFRRTRETAEPLVRRLKLTPATIAPQRGESVAVHAAAVAAWVRQQNQPVLVVGHSNTVPAIVAALGGSPLADLCESSFGHAFVLAPASGSLVHLHYGEADPTPGSDCL